MIYPITREALTLERNNFVTFAALRARCCDSFANRDRHGYLLIGINPLLLSRVVRECN